MIGGEICDVGFGRGSIMLDREAREKGRRGAGSKSA